MEPLNIRRDNLLSPTKTDATAELTTTTFDVLCYMFLWNGYYTAWMNEQFDLRHKTEELSR